MALTLDKKLQYNKLKNQAKIYEYKDNSNILTLELKYYEDKINIDTQIIKYLEEKLNNLTLDNYIKKHLVYYLQINYLKEELTKIDTKINSLAL